MIQIPRWKFVLVILMTVLAFAYSAPNVLNANTQAALRAAVPSWLPGKTVNLGLDLRGGAYLLYQVDVEAVLRQQAEKMLSEARREFSRQNIAYSDIDVLGSGIRVVLRDAGQNQNARQILRSLGQNADVRAAPDGLTLEVYPGDDGSQQIAGHMIERTAEVVRRRVAQLGTAGARLTREAGDRLLLQVPGANTEDLKRLVGTPAKLSFHLIEAQTKVAGGDVAAVADTEAASGTGGDMLALSGADMVGQGVQVARRAIITGEMIDEAEAGFDADGRGFVKFHLNTEGTKKMCQATTANTGKAYAVVLDDKILSMAMIRAPVCDGEGRISSGLDVQGANDMALLLRAGALPAPLSVIEERTVGSSLGADSIQSGQYASLIALVLVMGFMVLAYGAWGIAANVALVINIAMMFALLSVLQAVLTLPGIAGIVLTIGMAVDANVLIFERIRDELRGGRAPMEAVEAGYRRAMPSIVDSTLTTLIAAIILFSFGTGPVQGFAVTLGIGIVTSFLTAVVVTRVMVVGWFCKNRPAQVAI